MIDIPQCSCHVRQSRGLVSMPSVLCRLFSSLTAHFSREHLWFLPCLWFLTHSLSLTASYNCLLIIWMLILHVFLLPAGSLSVFAMELMFIFASCSAFFGERWRRVHILTSVTHFLIWCKSCPYLDNFRQSTYVHVQCISMPHDSHYLYDSVISIYVHNWHKMLSARV